jgi:regulator of protease activity HflC (stomatin/prohibitin superfamily)
MWKFVMRPKAKKELARIKEERDRTEEAIKRARRNKQRVTDLYDNARKLTKEAHRWEKYLP